MLNHDFSFLTQDVFLLSDIAFLKASEDKLQIIKHFRLICKTESGKQTLLFLLFKSEYDLQHAHFLFHVNIHMIKPK